MDINLESKEPMVIEIPFIYPLPSYDMIVEPDAYANMVFVVYSPLSGGTADFTVFARFKRLMFQCQLLKRYLRHEEL